MSRAITEAAPSAQRVISADDNIFTTPIEAMTQYPETFTSDRASRLMLMPPAELPQTAERVAALILRITKFMKKEDVYVALSCPTAAAFMIGSLLGTMRQFRVLHYEDKYTVIPDYSPSRFKKSLREET